MPRFLFATLAALLTVATGARAQAQLIPLPSNRADTTFDFVLSANDSKLTVHSQIVGPDKVLTLVGILCNEMTFRLAFMTTLANADPLVTQGLAIAAALGFVQGQDAATVASEFAKIAGIVGPDFVLHQAMIPYPMEASEAAQIASTLSAALGQFSTMSVTQGSGDPRLNAFTAGAAAVGAPVASCGVPAATHY